ncbi:hypothetical protein J2Z48_001789 [Croceifilum oryzae]|uniref:Uncharacterized protein n=1 Tax=Croceifilum oryzae TaxID=1553429 RepID=A0AAJ1TN57_9BACL|nr:hypothetical protein [Croceifilum oryzae]
MNGGLWCTGEQQQPRLQVSIVAAVVRVYRWRMELFGLRMNLLLIKPTFAFKPGKHP